jgi:hypothetical protein
MGERAAMLVLTFWLLMLVVMCQGQDRLNADMRQTLRRPTDKTSVVVVMVVNRFTLVRATEKVDTPKDTANASSLSCGRNSLWHK